GSARDGWIVGTEYAQLRKMLAAQPDAVRECVLRAVGLHLNARPPALPHLSLRMRIFRQHSRERPRGGERKHGADHRRWDAFGVTHVPRARTTSTGSSST